MTHPYFTKLHMDPPVFDNGYDCLDLGITCKGDIPDTTYPNNRKFVGKSNLCISKFGNRCPIANRATLQADGSDFFLVVGVNHNATGRALFSSISLNSAKKLEAIGGFDSVSGDLSIGSYAGSADEYITNSEISKYFYAVKFSRKCMSGETFCFEVQQSGNNSLPIRGSAVFIERSYLDHMQSGPTKDAHVKPILYHFSSKQF